ncbi:unnamed protein product [Sphagnum troendelagicum]|uniref:EXS domain-containing protein n=1 Tax=Sphagnum troendelagicum TaxID=128251 RepID=A0ABP0UKI2_9BRYO
MVRMKEFPISHDKFFYEAYLYYNPMFLMSMMVWLWGLNMYGFLEARIPYAKVFDLEYDHLTHHDIWKIASCMTVVVLTSMTAYLYFYSQNMILEAALQPILLYVLMSVLLWLPSNVLYMRTRFDFLRTIVRLTFPIQTVSFAESLMADVLTSLAKPISDMERSICRMYHHQATTGACLEADAVCGGHSIYTPCILAFPYFSRFLQCLRQYRDTKDEMFLHNALKYATTSAIIFLPVLKYHVAPELWVSQVKPLWLMCTVLNSCCLFYWDITNDWEFGLLSSPWGARKQYLRPILLYRQHWVYYWAIGSNLVMRCAWTYKLSSHLRHNFKLVFFFSVLEMLRRFQWIFFRVEVAAIKLPSYCHCPTQVKILRFFVKGK